jgi:acyl transferase domain-containing protein
VTEFAGTSSFGMSGVNAHAIVQHTPIEAAAASGIVTSWQRSMRCFVDVLVALHPLLGTASKVWKIIC